MAEPSVNRLNIGEGAAARPIAVLARPGAAPGIFWLGGFRSEMTGGKASALDAFGAAEGLSVTRFDYSGHGQSGGDFFDGTIGRWLEEALAVFATTAGPQIVVGSSMGGWLALLLNKALRDAGKSRVKALILIAPAVDMTEELMRAEMTPAEVETLARRGFIEQPSEYSDEPYPITARLIEEGARHLLFGGPIETGCPVTILQGGEDRDVPQAHALRLVSHLLHDPVTLTLVPDGDHRLSREQDLDLLRAAVRRAVEED
jgi:pimeloyl-ACP methyl ester carboxylesterase